jgi:tetratricopeptide (TPR) repeat protein
MALRAGFVAAIAGVGLLVAWLGGGPARAGEPADAPTAPVPAAPTKPPAAPAQPSQQELAVRKIEKLLNSVRDKMNDFQKEEFQIEMVTIKSTGTALQAVKDPKKAADQIAKNTMTPEVKAYRDVALAAARDWQGFQQRYSAIGRTIKSLEREKPDAPANLQADIDSYVSKFNDKNRTLLMKVAGMYETAADYRGALGLLAAAYQDMPEAKRAGAQDLKMKMADLCAKTGDHVAALAALKSIFDAKPEQDRYKDAKLCEKMGDEYKATGDLKAALDLYKHALSATGSAKPAKGAKANKAVESLQKKIADLEKKIGPPAPASTPAPAKTPAK